MDSKDTKPEEGKKKAEEAKKVKEVSEEGAKATSEPKKKKKRSRKARNYDLGNGVYRFSRTRMYHKKALYKFIGKKTAAAKKPVKPLTVEKNVGGEKNGEKRIVLLRKRRNYYPTQDK